MALRKPIQILIEAKDKTAAAFRSVNRQLETAANRVRDIGSRLGLAFGVFAGGGLAASIKQTADSMDRLAKTAETIGATTEELSKLRFAADQTGISAQTLDSSLIRFTRRLADAAAGTGEAAGALEQLGLSAEKLAGLTLEQQIGQIADALEDIPRQSDKVAIAFDLFGREGSELVRTLAGGSDALDEFSQRLQELNGVVDGESAQAAENFNDELGKLNVQFEALGRSIGSSLIPNWTAWLQLVNEGSIARVGAGGLVSQEIEQINTKIVELKDKISELSNGPSIGDAIAARGVPLEQITEATERAGAELVKELEELEKRRAELINSQAEKRALKRRESEERRHNREMAAARDEQTKALQNALGQRAKLYQEHITNTQRYAQQQAQLTEQINSQLSDIGRSNEPVERIDVVRKSVEAWDQLSQGNFAQVLELVRDGLGLLSEYSGTGEESSASIDVLAESFRNLAEQASAAQQGDLKRSVENGKNLYQQVKQEIESTPAKLVVVPDSSSGKNVHTETQRQLVQEGPVVVDVALNITGVASGDAPAANGDESLVSEVENQSDKRGHRL